MSSILREDRYNCANSEKNENKFWNIRLASDATVTTHYGRVGEDGKETPKSFISLAAAESFYEGKCREKERHGYEKSRVISGATTVSVNPSVDVVLSQIVVNNPVLEDLKKRLAKANVHNILSASALTYSDTTGLFQTPLGVVTSEAIGDARRLLTDMASLVHIQNYDDPKWNRLLDRYLLTIPQAIGRNKPDPRVLYPDLNAIVQQNKLLDDLEASFQAVIAGNLPAGSAPAVPKVFDVTLSYVEDGKIIDRIRRKYESTRKSMHACYHLSVKNVYQIEISQMHQAFNNQGKTLGNVMELWHGTRVGNVLSILKSGLKVPPSSSPYVTGRLFGDGLYFSDQSTKSLNYAYGAAPGQRGGYESSTFMFLTDVAMGKVYTPNGYGGRFPHPGYDSTFAKANHSGVMNNEMIVYSTHQANLTYLVEFV